MSQADVYQVLKTKRLSGDDSYHSVKQIQKMLNGKGITIGIDSINNNLVALRCFGFVDIRIDSQKVNRTTYPFTVYRLKKEYIN